MKRLAAFLALTIALMTQISASGRHGNNSKAHWDRNNVEFVDSVEPTWDVSVTSGSLEWNPPGLTEITTSVVAGQDDAQTRKTCPYVNKSVRVCNFAYGTSGPWRGGVAGLAQYSYSLPSKHILKARIRLNDTNTSPASRNAVTVHEMGHTLGLDHRRPSQTSSCMTPSVTPTQTSPDDHDYNVVNKLHDHGHRAASSGGDDRSDHYTSPVRDERYSEVRRGNVVHVTWAIYLR